MVEAPKHTPGPWTAKWSRYRDGTFIVQAGAPSNRVLASFDGDGDGPDDQSIADARLIAENAKAAIWEMDTWIAEAESYLSALAANATKARVLAEAFGRDSHGNIINAEANAHLISAAPDMYEALKLARDCIWTGGDTISTLAKIDAALSKALGSPDPARSVDEQGRGTAA